MTMFLAPYTAIADIDGSPLDAGFLFFGEYGKDPELFPVEVFWDADFTVPAAQPIRTRNGYPVRNGSPTKVYLKTAQHSIVIKNRNGAFILVDFKNKGWDASFIVDGDENQHEINNKTTRQIANISDLKNYKPLKNSQIIQLIDYDENVQGVFNKYIYRASSNFTDNYGTVIASNVVAGRWVMLPKAEYIPEDFGVVSGDTFIATNTARITAYLQSGLSLYIPAKKYIVHPAFLSVTISKTTKIIGESISNSILEKLQIVTSGNCDSSEFKNFKVNTLSMNYSIYVNGGNYMNFENIHTYHSYDGICFYNNTGTKLKRNTVKNCISEKSGRVGFTVDVGGEDTIFENLTAIDCKQAYHFEGCKDSKLRNSKAISCGSGSSLSSGEQDAYAGPLRSYYVDGLEVDGLENITPVGTSQWQHGGGLNTDAVNSNDLVFKNLVNCGPLILDEENAKTRNATFKDIDQLAIYTTGFKQKFTGKVIVENCAAPLAGIDDLMIYGADTLILSESNFGRMQLKANKMRTHNILATTLYFHTIEAVDFKATGIFENIQTALGDPEWHHGFVFTMTSCVRLVADTIRLGGFGTGWHLTFDNLGATTREINLGDFQEDTSTAFRINGNVYGNKDVLSEFGIQYNSRRTFRRDTIATSGTYRVGDMILKNTIAADLIYGWICSTGGTGGAVVWKPLKHS